MPFGVPRPVGPSYPVAALHIIVLHEPLLPVVTSCKLLLGEFRRYGTCAAFIDEDMPSARANTPAMSGEDRLVPPT
jgi:hypothetical protein